MGTGQPGAGQFGAQSIWRAVNLAPVNLAPRQFGAQSIWRRKFAVEHNL